MLLTQFIIIPKYRGENHTCKQVATTKAVRLNTLIAR
jgi:hypothetical protein